MATSPLKTPAKSGKQIASSPIVRSRTSPNAPVGQKGRLRDTPRSGAVKRQSIEPSSAFADSGVIVLRSKLTGQSQVFVPKLVRQLLGVAKGESLGYVIHDGKVTLERAAPEAEEHRDTAIESFLGLLTNDIAEGNASPVPAVWLQRARAVVEGVTFDRDEALEGGVGLD